MSADRSAADTAADRSGWGTDSRAVSADDAGRKNENRRRSGSRPRPVQAEVRPVKPENSRPPAPRPERPGDSKPRQPGKNYHRRSRTPKPQTGGEAPKA